MSQHVHLDLCRRAAVSRKPGYIEAITSKGVPDPARPGFLVLSDSDYGSIAREFEIIPGAAQLAINAAKAGARAAGAAATGRAIARTQAEVDLINPICEVCEFFSDGRCTKCGCFLKLKTRLATEHCPVGKW